jgi:hypothetical protein
MAKVTNAKLGNSRTLQFGMGGGPFGGEMGPSGMGMFGGSPFSDSNGNGEPPNPGNDTFPGDLRPPVGDGFEGDSEGREQGISEFLKQLGVPEVFENALVNVTCTVPNTTDALVPDCAYNPMGDLGAWVCRTLYDPITGLPVTQSTCVDTDGKGLDSDTCGCCDSVCPVPCACACEIETFDGEIIEGVYVNMTHHEHLGFNPMSNWTSIEMNETAARCIPTAWATTILAQNNARGDPSCVATCPVA